MVLMPTGPLKIQQQLLSKILPKCLPPTHRNIYAVPGKNPLDLVWRILVAKRAGYFLGKADLKSAFHRTHLPKLQKQLLKNRLPAALLHSLGLTPEAIQIENSRKSHRGLPQGFNTSPILYAHYLEPVVRRLNNGRHTVFFYVDDLYWLARTKRAAHKSLKFIQKVLYEHDRHLILNSRPAKSPRILKSTQTWTVLGFSIT